MLFSCYFHAVFILLSCFMLHVFTLLSCFIFDFFMFLHFFHVSFTHSLSQDTLTTYISSLNSTIEEFYDEVSTFKNEENDPYIAQFIECLLASADYDSFYRVMVREGKKSKAARAAAGGPVLTANPMRRADAKHEDSDVADSKSSASAADAKGEGGSFKGESKGDSDRVDSK